MTLRLLSGSILAAATALGMSAVPAFTATPSDNGSVVGTVTALGGGACLQLSDTAVSFGALPFSTPTQVSSAPGTPTPSFQNCGNFNENISIAGTDATGVNALWQLTTKYGGNPCFDSGGLAQTNAYGVAFDAAPAVHGHISKTATPIATYAAGATTTLPLTLDMPCIGSSGNGQIVSFSVNLTAAVA
jgi:hypothetical protein